MALFSAPQLASSGGGPKEPVDIVVLATAALPWRTGPSIFSMWHAGGLAALGYRVAYGVPWLDATSQTRLWGEVLFETPDDQIRWLGEEAERLNIPPLPDIFFFKGFFWPWAYSIFMLQDAYANAPPSKAVLMHEPEHFGWTPFTRNRKDVPARRIVGIVMTNYRFYIAKRGKPIRTVFSRMVEWNHRNIMRWFTDAIVPLSPAIDLSRLRHPIDRRPVTGVLDAFAEVPPVREDQKGVYFLGRMTWDKGLDHLMDTASRMGLPMDIYGDGGDRAAIQARATKIQAPVRFLGPSSSPWEVMADYKVFYNPSLSEVLCTTTAEALVGGRHVVLPACPANEPFYDLPNVHVYRHEDGADAALRAAIDASILPPTQARDRFNWERVCRSVADLLTTGDRVPAPSSPGRETADHGREDLDEVVHIGAGR